MNTFIYFEIIKFIYVFVFLAIIRLVIWEQFYININFKMSWTFLYFWIMPHFRLVIVEISIQIEFNKWKVYLQIIYIILYYIYIFSSLSLFSLMRTKFYPYTHSKLRKSTRRFIYIYIHRKPFILYLFLYYYMCFILSLSLSRFFCCFSFVSFKLFNDDDDDDNEKNCILNYGVRFNN